MSHPHRVIHIQSAAPPKPPVGMPCNGCGVCCLAEPCPLGMLLSRQRLGACKALRWDEAQQLYRCGALTDTVAVVQAALPARWPALARAMAPALQALAARWIAAGHGCDSSLEPQIPLAGGGGGVGSTTISATGAQPTSPPRVNRPQKDV